MSPKRKTQKQKDNPMSIKYITNRIAIDTDMTREIYDNGESGDQKVTLCQGFTEEGECHYYLETNGDPVLVTEDNEYECAMDLGLGDVSELKELY